MRFLICFLKLLAHISVLLAFLLLATCTNVQGLSTQEEIDRSDSAVQVLVYASADNRDEENISADVAELMSSQVSENFQFWLLYDTGMSESESNAGLYSGVAGFWQTLNLSPLGVDSARNLNMGSADLLRNFVQRVVPAQEGTVLSVILIILSESGAVFEGPVYDEGSNDFLTANEIARVTAEVEIDLLVIDAGFTGGLEFLYEFSDASRQPQPLFLVSPAAFPQTGRNYANIFSNTQGELAQAIRSASNRKTRARDIALHMQAAFLQQHADNPQSTQILVDPAQTQSVLESLNVLIAESASASAEELEALRSTLFLASPVYYQTPGFAHYGLSAVAASIEGISGIQASSAAAFREAAQGLYVGEAGRGEASLIVVPILSNGRPDPNFPPSYTREGSQLLFARSSRWLPSTAEEGGFLQRVWID